MNTIGFLISDKENEKRRAITPNDIRLVKCSENLYFESGYGESLGFSDEDYLDQGCNVVDRDIVFQQDILCDPKVGDAKYLSDLKKGTIIFGWIHAVQNRELTHLLVEKEITAIAWEDMYERGRHIFWRNNEIAGEAAILHAFTLYGKMPYECNVALIGKGNIARGAFKILTNLGANVVVYDRYSEELLRVELNQYDVIVNGILWDIERKDHIIYKNDLKRIKSPGMIIDISCDRNGAIQTSIPTSIESPIYYEENVLHYVVDHTPALVSQTVSKSISYEVKNYLDDLISNEFKSNSVLKNAIIIENGKIVDEKIIKFQSKTIEV